MRRALVFRPQLRKLPSRCIVGKKPLTLRRFAAPPSPAASRGQRLGVQLFLIHRRRPRHLRSLSQSGSIAGWVPAFAGMTKSGCCGPPSRHSRESGNLARMMEAAGAACQLLLAFFFLQLGSRFRGNEEGGFVLGSRVREMTS